MFLKLVLFLLKLYQYIISPLYYPCCRFSPSCSHYMIQAIKIHGVFGIVLGIIRLLKCNPFGKFGHDPVPKSKFLMKWKKNEK